MIEALMIQRILSRIWICFCLTALLLPGCSSPAAPGTMDLPIIPAPSLSNNILGEKNQQSIAIYLPSSYANGSKRYPVIYYLTGLGVQLGSENGYPLLRKAMDAALANRKTGEMILVTVSGFNALGGSFYANSPVTGNWEDFVVRDVVGYVDAHYRTLAYPDSRGIAGHSMGGFGALRIAMRHPDVFGAVYALSPALLAPSDLSQTEMFASQDTIDSVVKMINDLTELPADQAARAFLQAYAEASQSVRYTIAYGAALAPSPDRKPPFVAYPFHNENGITVKDETLWLQWQNGFGEVGGFVQTYLDNWKKLKAVGFEYGKQDENTWLPDGCQYLAKQLNAARIANTLNTFEGTHYDHLEQRIEEAMLPFMVKVFGD